MYLSKGLSVFDNSKIKSLILSLSVTVNLATRHYVITAEDRSGIAAAHYVICKMHYAGRFALG